ncbi:ankyrin repeat-containing protein [Penicillium paradoxum]|uniref:ankyrin repeat-containing protein n=1 Tax=Penicillium paradoxum TaxID=176176 RepID=UPI002547FE44|nr:ankyrin repeat-containing protein [Penicillium paradoxum]KAJ5788731.1 ankyrin repeat-containing protein [Penicillium paradoxum]
MEALGLIANIAAVVQLAAQVTQLSYSYVQEVKNAPKIQKKYLQEVSALMDVLFRIEQTIVDAEPTGLLPPRPPSLDDDALMDCYKELSLLHFELQKRKSRLLRPFQERELRPHIEMLHKFRENLSEYLSACVLVTTNATYQKVSSISIEQDRTMLLTLLPPVEMQLREKLISCPGTGQWFLNHPIVKCWIDRSSRMLWCHGPQNLTSSIVVDHLAKKSLGDALVVYFFCDFPSQTEHTAVNILRCISRQLIQRGSEDVLSTLKEFLDQSNPPQNAADIAEIIAKAGSVQPIYLVIDAVDEIKLPGEILDHCLALATSGIYVLVTSRKLPHIQKKMITASQLEITGSTHDLKTYIEKRLKESDFEDELAEDDTLIDGIVSKSGNLFLLARLTLDELLSLTTVGQIRKTLKKQALGLQQTFESTMQRIDDQSKARSSMARRLISWILYAKRRFKVEEIMTAFAIDEDGLDYENMPTPDILLRICVGMVVFNQAENTFGLVHTSAYEYLYTFISPETSHFDIAQTSLRYLGLKGLISEPCNTSKELVARFDELKFLSYSAKYWGHHICSQDSEKRLQLLIMALLNDEKLLNSVFQALQFRPEFEGGIADEMFDSVPKGQHALDMTAYWNLSETAKIILEAEANASPTDSHKWTPLHWACSKGHLAVSSVLIHKGADPNLPDIQGWTPLFWAAFIGNIELVRLLLSNGVDHQFRSTLGWTALHWAISGGHLSVVQELLGHHSRSTKKVAPLYTMTMAQIKPYSQGNVTPIEFAGDTKDGDLFGLLVRHLETRKGKLGDVRFNCIWETARFDFPVSRNPWRTLTKGEQVNGIESIIPDISEDRYGSAELEEHMRSDPLHWKSVLLVSAIRDAQLSSAQMLAQSGASSEYYFALHMAARRKDPRYVQCLLQTGADTALTDDQGRTALHIAILNGFVETMTSLIDGGSNVNQHMPTKASLRLNRKGHNSAGVPPLILAGGSVRMVRILLSNGADLMLRDDSERTALNRAFFRRDIRLIKLLLEFGAPIDTAGPYGQAPLHSLTRCDDTQCEMEDLKAVVLLFIAAGRKLSPPREFLNEKVHASSLADSPEGMSNNLTPLTMALLEGRWKFLHIFSELGATFHSHLDLIPGKGCHSPPNSVILLVESFIRQRESSKEDSSILCDRFNRTLEALCSTGADINFYGTIEKRDKIRDTREMTALTLAATICGSRDISPNLLSRGANLYCRSLQTFDPILTAALFGEQEDLSSLLNRSIFHPNPSHWTRFLKEAPEESDSTKLVCFCLRRAKRLNKTNHEGQTLLDLAVQEGNVRLMTALMAEGAEGHTPDNDCHSATDTSQTDAMLGHISSPVPLEDATSLELAVKNHNVATVAKLLEAGTNPNQTIAEWKNNIPLLYHAARDDQLEILSLLLSHGADTEAADDYGWRPLHVACFRGHKHIVEALISEGADAHASATRWNNDQEKPSGLYQGEAWTGTSLHTATIRGNLDIVKLLFEQNVDIHAVTGVTDRHSAYPASGPTALHIALSVNQVPLLEEGGRILRARRLPTIERLQIAQWLVDAGAMVHGVIQQYSLEEILCFAKFPNLWDALVAGEKGEAV